MGIPSDCVTLCGKWVERTKWLFALPLVLLSSSADGAITDFWAARYHVELDFGLSSDLIPLEDYHPSQMTRVKIGRKSMMCTLPISEASLDGSVAGEKEVSSREAVMLSDCEDVEKLLASGETLENNSVFREKNLFERFSHPRRLEFVGKRSGLEGSVVLTPFANQYYQQEQRRLYENQKNEEFQARQEGNRVNHTAKLDSGGIGDSEGAFDSEGTPESNTISDSGDISELEDISADYDEDDIDSLLPDEITAIRPRVNAPLTEVFGPPVDTYMTRSKLNTFDSNCVTFKSVNDEAWSYELCLAQSVTATNSVSGEVLSFGVFDSDELFADGRVNKFYRHGTDGRSATAMLSCNSSQYGLNVDGITVNPDHVQIDISNAAHCDWRDPNRRPPLENLLFPLKDWCTNTTKGIYTYEYCYPDHLLRFEIETTSGRRKGPLTLLGTLYRPSAVMGAGSLGAPSVDFIAPRGNRVSDDSVVKNLPLQIVRSEPLRSSQTQLHRSVALSLTRGSHCGEKRQDARILFQCQLDFAGHARVIKVIQTSACAHDFVVETPYVCPLPESVLPYITNVGLTRCFLETTRKVEKHSSAVVEDEQSTTALLEWRQGDLLEALPEVLTTADLGKFFGFNPSIRLRGIYADEPIFKIGQAVKHKWYAISGVIVGWDSHCQANNGWKNMIFDPLTGQYPRELQRQPWYRILLDLQTEIYVPSKGGVRTFKLQASGTSLPTYIYTPEVSLKETSVQLQKRNPLISLYFSHFEKQLDRYIADEKHFGIYRNDYPLSHAELLKSQSAIALAMRPHSPSSSSSEGEEKEGGNIARLDKMIPGGTRLEDDDAENISSSSLEDETEVTDELSIQETRWDESPSHSWVGAEAELSHSEEADIEQMKTTVQSSDSGSSRGEDSWNDGSPYELFIDDAEDEDYLQVSQAEL